MLAQQHYEPMNSTKWTIRNKDQVEVYKICKFHTAAKANLCAYGDQCRYIHYDQLHRPSLAEQNAQQTLQQQILSALCSLNLVLTAILPLLNGLNNTANDSTTLSGNKSPARPPKRAFAWATLTANDSCYHNETILSLFINNLSPFYGDDAKETPKFKTLCADTVKMAKTKGLGITLRDCPKIISLFYCLAFHCEVHVVRIFEIPASWTPQLWTDDSIIDTDVFVLQPPTH